MATFYANSAGSQGTGDGSSEANACTLKEFIENDPVLHTALSAGSVCYCKNGTEITWDSAVGVYATTAASGTSIGPIRVVGYNATPGDGGILELRDTDGPASPSNHCFVLNHNYWSFENVLVKDTRDCWNMPSPDGHMFRRCGGTGGGSAGEGWDGGASGNSSCWVDCVVEGKNRGWTNGMRNARYINCAAINCVSHGWNSGSTYGAQFVNCLAHANGGNGFNISGTATLTNCVANRNSGSGFVVDTSGPHVFTNCGATSNGAYGIAGSGAGARAFLTNCAMNPTGEVNTSGKSSSITLIETDEVTGDPDFTDSNPGTPIDVDLSLSATSAWKAAGVGSFGPTSVFSGTASFADIGPAQRQESGGGGFVNREGLQAIEQGVCA